MTRPWLHLRIVAALRLAPMTTTELARCLCSRQQTIHRSLSMLERAGRVRNLGADRTAKLAYRFEVAALATEGHA
jgi:DNA-binding IclR family transcriptional regulator